MKLGKKLGIGVAGLLLVILLAVGGIVLFIDSIAKSAIEKGGTYAMGVPTTLDSASVGVMSGTFSMKGLKVANPEGFQAKEFFTLGSGGVAADLGSVTKPVVHVPRLELSTIRVSLERSSKGSNYDVILRNLKRFESKDGTATKDQGEGRKFTIKEVVVRDVEVRVDLIGLPGSASAVTIPIHEIKLKDVGTAEGGMTAGQIAGTVVKAVLATAVERGGNIIPGDVLGELKGGLSQLGNLDKFGVEVVGKAGETAQKLAEGLTKVGQDAADSVKKGAEGLLKGVGDLIPGKK